MAKVITIDIKGGSTTVATRGFTGKACQDATAELEKALGFKTSDAKTPEFDVKSAQVTGQ